MLGQLRQSISGLRLGAIPVVIGKASVVFPTARGPGLAYNVVMRIVILTLLLSACATPAPQASTPVQAASYRTAKGAAEVERCLADALSTRGEVTAINTGGVTTVMLRDGSEPPMLIDIAVPAVTITTRIAYGTRALIEHCM